MKYWLWLVLAVAVTVLAFVTMRSPVRADGAEVRFVREMTQHHLQAVDMAVRMRDRTNDPVLRALALDILLSQQEQVGRMRGWLSLWGVPWGGKGMSGEHARVMGMATPEEIKSISTLPVAEAERAFLQLMIRHHQGAIAMTNDILQQRTPAVLRELAQQMHDAQAGEIELMETLLEARGSAPLPPQSAPGDHQHHDTH